MVKTELTPEMKERYRFNRKLIRAMGVNPIKLPLIDLLGHQEVLSLDDVVEGIMEVHPGLDRTDAENMVPETINESYEPYPSKYIAFSFQEYPAPEGETGPFYLFHSHSIARLA